MALRAKRVWFCLAGILRLVKGFPAIQYKPWVRRGTRVAGRRDGAGDLKRTHVLRVQGQEVGYLEVTGQMVEGQVQVHTPPINALIPWWGKRFTAQERGGQQVLTISRTFL